MSGTTLRRHENSRLVKKGLESISLVEDETRILVRGPKVSEAGTKRSREVLPPTRDLKNSVQWIPIPQAIVVKGRS